MDIEKLIGAVRLCGSTPKVDQCKRCTYWSGGDMSKCIPRMTTDAATALSTLQSENEKLRAELDDLKAKWDKYQPREHWETLNELCENLHDELEQVKAALRREQDGE